MTQENSQYTKELIATAKDLLASREFDLVLAQVLIPHNNYHSGWTQDVAQIFYEPANQEEQLLADQLTEIIKQTVAGLLETAQATSELFGYAVLEYLATFLHRLGKKAPPELVKKTRKLIEESQQLGAPEIGLILVPSLTLLAELED